MEAKFTPGKDIAIKVPKYKYEETVNFYQSVLHLTIKEQNDATVAFQFGEITLWIDSMENYSQGDVWLEVLTDDLAQAAEYCNEHKVPRRDEIEKQTRGFWISDPVGTILRIGEE
jgi:hypothetical protein